MSIELDGEDPIAATPTFDEASSTSSSSSGEKVRATISLEETVATYSADSPTPSRQAGADGLQDSALYCYYYSLADEGFRVFGLPTVNP